VNSTIVDPKHFDPKIVRGVQGDVCIIPPEFVYAGAVSGYFPDSAERADDLPRQIDVCAMRIIVNGHRSNRQWEGFVTLEISNYDTAAREDLRE